MDIFTLNEKFVDISMIRHKFDLIVNAMNDQGRKCSTKDQEILFKKSLHLINCQAEAMCKMLKIECCKCQQCSQKSVESRKRVGHHLGETSEKMKKAKKRKKEISKDLPLNNQIPSLKLSKKSSSVFEDQLKRNVKLELLRKKVKDHTDRIRANKRVARYPNSDLKIFRDYLTSVPCADVALEFFGISNYQLGNICCCIRKFFDSNFRNPETKKQKEETIIYNYYVENGIEATMKRYNVTKKRVFEIRNRKASTIIDYVKRVLKRLKPAVGSNAKTSLKNGEKQKQLFNSSTISCEEKKAIFHTFTSCDQKNYPLNACTVQKIVKQVKRYFARSDQLIDVDRDVCVRLLSEFRK